MPTRDISTVVHIYQAIESRVIGHNSPYAEIEHLGTSNRIEGWKWDERFWPTSEELEAISLAPSIWDADTTGLLESYFQSGYGDNNDLLFLDVQSMSLSGVSAWIPKIQTGYFYSRDEEWYLFSDWYQTEIAEKNDVVSGVNYIDLSYDYKPTYPIQVRRFTFDAITGRHQVDLDIRKVIDLDVGGDDPEFSVDLSYSPPRLWLNNDYIEEVGTEVEFIVSGVGDPDTVSQLEKVGVSNGEANQLFHFVYSPVDPTQPIDVWTYNSMTDLVQWTVISGIQPFTEGDSTEVRVDIDRGSIEFGDYILDSGAGMVPPAGVKVAVRYTKSIAAVYEPEHAKDYVLAVTANVNPTESASNKGFVQVSTVNFEPAYIYLSVSGVEEEAGGGFPTQLGNNVEKLVATVKDLGGNSIEGANVTFELLSPVAGSFGGANTFTSSTTNVLGKALARYNSPLTIDEIGKVVLSPTIGGGQTILNVSDMIVPLSVSGLWVYQIRDDDPIVGIPEGDLNSYYEDFMTEEDITTGGTADIDWEKDHRTVQNLSVPITYAPTELVTGKKRIMLTSGRSSSVDPHDGDYDSAIYVPVYPSTINIIGEGNASELEIIYNQEFPAVVSGVKGYFVVGNNRTRVRAYTTNGRTNQRVYSNEISINIYIPDYANGTFFANALTDVQNGMLTAVRDVDILSDAVINQTSGIEEFWDAYEDEKYPSETYVEWFRRTRRGDTEGLVTAAEYVAGLDPGLPIVSYMAGGYAEIPVGWRLKSTGITVASVLDQITWLDPNDHLSSGYWED